MGCVCRICGASSSKPQLFGSCVGSASQNKGSRVQGFKGSRVQGFKSSKVRRFKGAPTETISVDVDEPPPVGFLMAAIETEDLTKDYFVGFWRPKPYRALDRLTLSIEAGEVFGFLGPNG